MKRSTGAGRWRQRSDFEAGGVAGGGQRVDQTHHAVDDGSRPWNRRSWSGGKGQGDSRAGRPPPARVLRRPLDADQVRPASPAKVAPIPTREEHGHVPRPSPSGSTRPQRPADAAIALAQSFGAHLTALNHVDSTRLPPYIRAHPGRRVKARTIAPREAAADEAGRGFEAIAGAEGLASVEVRRLAGDPVTAISTSALCRPARHRAARSPDGGRTRRRDFPDRAIPPPAGPPDDSLRRGLSDRRLARRGGSNATRANPPARWSMRCRCCSVRRGHHHRRRRQAGRRRDGETPGGHRRSTSRATACRST